MELNKIYNGDSLEVLKTFPDECIDMCITSPPYWGLRDYGVEGQLGLEKDFNEYIDKLCTIFDEVKRTLKDSGTCWVNIGDSYGGSGNASGHTKDTKNLGYTTSKMGATKGHTQGLQPKSLIGIPFRFALEMINRGWILRNTIIWHKPNCMPSSVKDRFTVDFEYLFFFSKNKKYYFEQQFDDIKIQSQERMMRGMSNKHKNINGAPGQTPHSMNKPRTNDKTRKVPSKRNKRTVWTITTKPYKDAHFAVYPPELIETPIKAGCPVNGVVLDPFIGSGTTAAVAKRLNRNYIGIELNPNYIPLINERLKSIQKVLV